MNRSNPWVSTFLTNILVLAIGILTGILAARLLLPEGRGALAAILFWPQLIGGIGLVSLNEAITYKCRQDSDSGQNLIPSVAVMASIWGVIVALLSCAALPWLLGSDRIEELPLAQWYLLAFVPLYILAMCLIAVEHARLEFEMLNIYRLTVPIVYLFGLVVLWVGNSLSVRNVALANLLGTAVVVILSLARQDRDIFEQPSLKSALELLRIAIHFHFVAVLRQLNSQIDRLLVLLLFGNFAVGIYTAAFTYASSGLVSITESFLSMMFPRLVGQDRELQIRYLAKGLRYSTLFIVIGTIPLFALAWILVPFLFGKEYGEAIIASQVLLVAYAPLAIRQILSRNLRGLGFAWHGAEAEIASLVVFLVIAWPLSSKWGLSGVGGSLFVANALSLALLVMRARSSLGLSLQDCWGLNLATVNEVVSWAYRSNQTGKSKAETHSNE